jgi:hypothetical protein
MAVFLPGLSDFGKMKKPRSDIQSETTAQDRDRAALAPSPVSAEQKWATRSESLQSGIVPGDVRPLKDPCARRALRGSGIKLCARDREMATPVAMRIL